MSEHPKIDLDELISLYLDGEASVRQETELKRLMQHDASIGERLDALRRQQELLNALPVEAAPEMLLDDIRAQMERKLILDNTVVESQTFLATGRLMVRRMLTTAAMILLPLGLLGLVVFQIMKPPAAGPADYVPVDRTMADANPAADPAVSQEVVPLPFRGVLVLRTEHFTDVYAQIREAIDRRQLLGQAFPDRTANVASFKINASPNQVAELVDALAVVRPRCSDVALRVLRETPADVIDIPDIQTKQLKMLVYEASPEMYSRLATRYASANLKVKPSDDNPLLNPDGYPQPSIPTLAGNYAPLSRSVELVIQIERAAQ
jgi:hypothetical protein